MNINDLLILILSFASENKSPDIHLNSNAIPRVRDNNGKIIELNEIKGKKIPAFTIDNISDIIKILIGEKGYFEFLENKEYDSSYKIESGDRYRVNCYMDTNGYSVAFRLIPKKIPTLKEIGLGNQIIEMCNKSKGLILVTGPTGSGKSTNLAAMIDYINSNFPKHIITIEDPVEFAFESKQSLVNQREIGSHTLGFDKAIRASLREDPDVIMIGEMRDPETIKAAITLAETGHLVISTLHTNDSVQSIDRIIDVFPSSQQSQIRMQLSQSLVGIISQRLLPKSNGAGRIAAREILVTNDAVKNLIISGKTHQLYSVLEVGKKEGMILMDKYLEILYTKGIITKEVLLSYVRDKESVGLMFK